VVGIVAAQSRSKNASFGWAMGKIKAMIEKRMESKIIAENPVKYFFA
jgi:hypothetical protein